MWDTIYGIQYVRIIIRTLSVQDEHHGGIHLASWRWEKYSSALMFTGPSLFYLSFQIIQFNKFIRYF